MSTIPTTTRATAAATVSPRGACRRTVAASASPRGDAEASSSSSTSPSSPPVHLRRRHALVALVAAAVAPSGPEQRASALPLAPLGEVKRVGGDKRTDLTAEKVRDQLERDLRDGQYFVTGNLTREIFADDCRFTDPTNDVVGLSRYLTALGLLFDPATSSVDLYDIKVTSPDTVEADWQLQGYLGSRGSRAWTLLGPYRVLSRPRDEAGAEPVPDVEHIGRRKPSRSRSRRRRDRRRDVPRVAGRKGGRRGRVGRKEGRKAPARDSASYVAFY